jgi:hypothetical protein
LNDLLDLGRGLVRLRLRAARVAVQHGAVSRVCGTHDLRNQPRETPSDQQTTDNCERFALPQPLKHALPPGFPGDRVHARLLPYCASYRLDDEVWSALELFMMWWHHLTFTMWWHVSFRLNKPPMCPQLELGNVWYALIALQTWVWSAFIDVWQMALMRRRRLVLLKNNSTCHQRCRAAQPGAPDRKVVGEEHEPLLRVEIDGGNPPQWNGLHRGCLGATEHDGLMALDSTGLVDRPGEAPDIGGPRFPRITKKASASVIA